MKAIGEQLEELLPQIEQDLSRYSVYNRERFVRLVKIAIIQSNVLERMPLCPDHRDKVRGERCLKCQIEELESSVTSLHLGRTE